MLNLTGVFIVLVTCSVLVIVITMLLSYVLGSWLLEILNK